MSGLVGCAAVIVGNVAGIMIYERHDPISDTISDLAAGRYAWIQDAGLLAFAIGIAATAAGMARWPSHGGKTWRLAAWLVALIAIDVAVIAAHNEYGDRDSGAFVIHSYAVYALAALFALASSLAAPALGRLGRGWRHFSWAVPVVWLIAGPVFFVAPTAWDGAYERGLALVVVSWFGAIGLLLMRQPVRGIEASSP